MIMRKLTLYPRMGSSNLNILENLISDKIPILISDFLKENAGLSHYERYYKDDKNVIWEVSKYLTFGEMFKLTQEFLREYKPRLLPFAYDPGGWHFCLSFDQESYGKIIINRWTDHKPEDQFLVIANNFEDFINGLRKENE